MTREEAIKLIGGMKSDFNDFYDYDDLAALDMAISALSVPEGEYINKSVVLTEMDKRHAEGDFITKGFINSLPTISVSEREKGEWVLKQRGKFVDMTCSKCGYVRIKDYAYNYAVEEIEKEFNKDNAKPIFCECCGADMRGQA